MLRWLVVAAAVTAVLLVTAGTLVAIIYTRQHPGVTTEPSLAPIMTASNPATQPGTSAAPPTTPGPSASSGGSHPTGTQPGPGRPPVPARLAGKDVQTIPTSRPEVALTFDAGANGDGLVPIMATLSAQHVPGTFFLTGDFAGRYPAAVRAIAAAGHRVGNHSLAHPYFTALPDAAIGRELAGAEAAVTAAGGGSTRPLFRFPYGDRDNRTIAAVNAAGYVCVRWTVDTLGWQGTSGGITTQVVVDRVLAAARPGEIVLMHIGSHPTDHSTLDADALPAVISRLRDRGYGFVTLDALLNS